MPIPTGEARARVKLLVAASLRTGAERDLARAWDLEIEAYTPEAIEWVGTNPEDGHSVIWANSAPGTYETLGVAAAAREGLQITKSKGQAKEHARLLACVKLLGITLWLEARS